MGGVGVKSADENDPLTRARVLVPRRFGSTRLRSTLFKSSVRSLRNVLPANLPVSTIAYLRRRV